MGKEVLNLTGLEDRKASILPRVKRFHKCVLVSVHEMEY